MKVQITDLEVTFSRGSFAEWCLAGGDEIEQDDIERWGIAYNEQITDELKKVYPHAQVTAGEGYDQLMSTKIYFGIEEVETAEDYNVDEWFDFDREIEGVVSNICDRVANDGSFWEA